MSRLSKELADNMASSGTFGETEILDRVQKFCDTRASFPGDHEVQKDPKGKYIVVKSEVEALLSMNVKTEAMKRVCTEVVDANEDEMVELVQTIGKKTEEKSQLAKKLGKAFEANCKKACRGGRAKKPKKGEL